MNDNTASDCDREPPSAKKDMSPQIANFYKATIDNIEFAKKHQWRVTNYTVLIYAAIFGVSRLLTQPVEKLVLGGLTIITAVAAIALPAQIQYDTGKYRIRLQTMHEIWFTPEERKLFRIEPYKNPALRGLRFLLALIGVAVFGAAIVIYTLSTVGIPPPASASSHAASPGLMIDRYS